MTGTTLMHHIGEKGVCTREKALERFFEEMRSANGVRRTDPEKFIKVRKVVQRRSNNNVSYDIYYTVPSRFRRR